MAPPSERQINLEKLAATLDVRLKYAEAAIDELKNSIRTSGQAHSDFKLTVTEQCTRIEGHVEELRKSTDTLSTRKYGLRSMLLVAIISSILSALLTLGGQFAFRMAYPGSGDSKPVQTKTQ